MKWSFCHSVMVTEMPQYSSDLVLFAMEYQNVGMLKWHPHRVNGTMFIRPLKKIVGDRPRPPHEKGPAPKNILFFIFQKTAKKRFNVDYYGPLTADSSTSLVLTKFSLLRPSAPLSVIIEVEIAHAR
jgi:hypothetical protein